MPGHHRTQWGENVMSCQVYTNPPTCVDDVTPMCGMHMVCVAASNTTQVAPTKVAPTKVAPTKVAPTKVAPTKVAPTKVAPTVTWVFEDHAVGDSGVYKGAINLNWGQTTMP